MICFYYRIPLYSSIFCFCLYCWVPVRVPKRKKVTNTKHPDPERGRPSLTLTAKALEDMMRQKNRAFEEKSG